MRCRSVSAPCARTPGSSRGSVCFSRALLVALPLVRVPVSEEHWSSPERQRDKTRSVVGAGDLRASRRLAWSAGFVELQVADSRSTNEAVCELDDGVRSRREGGSGGSRDSCLSSDGGDTARGHERTAGREPRLFLPNSFSPSSASGTCPLFGALFLFRCRLLEGLDARGSGSDGGRGVEVSLVSYCG